MYGMYKSVMIFLYLVQTCSLPFYLWQPGYGSYETATYEVDGINIYYPVSGDRVGYTPFPSSPYIQNIELRGADIKDGFKQKGKNDL